MKSMIKALVAAPLLIAASTSFAGTPTTTTTEVYANNTLQKLAEYSGKNYNVAIAGSDLVKDIGTDEQADTLDLPRTVKINIPQGATVEAAYVSYYGSAFLKEESSSSTSSWSWWGSTSTSEVNDDTPDTYKSGGEAELDTLEDIANNEINITVDGADLGALTPTATAAGPLSESVTAWWKMWASAGTLEDSKIAIYNNRLDLTSQFTGLTGEIPVTVTRLQRVDFTGASSSAMEGFATPVGNNDNGHNANDCLGNASFSVMVIYSMPTGEHKTVSIYDGMAWGWNNDFATDGSKAHSPKSGPMSLKVEMQHEAIDASGEANLYLAAVDGDKLGHSDIDQCGSSSFPHTTGHDYTWVTSGNKPSKQYDDIYEGKHAPDVGTAFNAYPEVTTVANGLNFNIVKIDVQNLDDDATQTVVDVEGDNPNSMQKEQEAMLIGFMVLEAKTKAQPEDLQGSNTGPEVTMIGDAEMTLTVGDTFTDPGATVFDLEDDPNPELATNCNVSTTTAGTYTCVYSATDSGGLSDSETRTVIVKERDQPVDAKPEIALNGAAEVTLEFGASWTDPGATATDAEDGTLTPQINCPVNTQVADTYTCTYTATDSKNQSASVTRTVVVKPKAVQQACFTATYDQHIAAGRAYESWYSVYATGSETYLGNSFMGGTATLVETAPGQWNTGTCP